MKKRHVLIRRNLMAHKYQFAALGVIFLLGVTIFISMTVAFHNMSSSYQHTYQELRFADFTIRAQGIPQEVLEQVRGLDNVAAAEGRLVLDTGLILSETDQVHARLIGLPPSRHPEVNNILVQSGTYWTPADSSGILVESHFAQYHTLDVEDSLTFITPTGERRFVVRGKAASPEYLVNAASQLDLLPSPRRFGVFFLPLPQLQHLFGMANRVNDLAVLVRDPDQRQDTIEAVQSLLRPYNIVQTVRREDQPSNAALQLDLQGAQQFANLLPILVLAIAALSIYIAMSRMVQAQRQHIGLFMALGYGRGHVLLHYLTYALLTALVGSALGVALGLWSASLITSMYADTLGIPLVQQQFQPMPIVEAVVVSSVIALLASLGPAWQSARMHPAQAMRLAPHTALVKGSVPWIERTVRLLFVPPMVLRIPLRAVSRSRARTFYTATGVCFAVVLLLTAAVNFDTVNHMLDIQFRQVERWDLDVTINPSTDPSPLEAIASWNDVQAAEPLLQAFGTLEYQGNQADVVVLAVSSDTRLHHFRLSGNDDLSLGNGNVILTPYASQQTRARRGEQVTLVTPAGQHTFTIAGISQEALGSGVYLSLPDAQAALGMPGVYNGIRIGAEAGTAEALKARLYRLPGVQSVNLKESTIQDWNELLALFYALAGVLLVFALIMAFAILFNTVTVNVLERQREIATMRTLGETSQRIALMMLLENLLVGVGALLPGILLGTLVAAYTIQTFNSEMFTMQFYISPVSYAAVTVGVILTVALSVVPAIRRVSRINLAEATKVLT